MSEDQQGIDRENPWPGLASFTEDSREFFFGRENETDELSRLVRRQTLTVLFGQSGLGKSSLLNAGLFPILRETDHLPLYLRLDHSSSTPPLADQVKTALTAAFVAVKAEAPAFRVGETLWEYFHRKDVDIWSAKNRLLTPVLAFDQFEEIFTLGRADEASRERSRVFLAELACLVENRAPATVQAKLDCGELDPASFNFAKPSCQVILSLREDFLPDLEGLKQSMPALVHNRLRLKKLSGTQALEIVTKPAPHLLAEGVAEKIVEFVASARGGSAERLAELDVEPPLLSVICRELNNRRRSLGQEKITADLVSGNRREILTDFYERSVADLPAPMRTFVEDHLLTKSGFRDNLALETALDFPGVTRPLLDTLVARRLIRIEDRLGLQRVELTHDVLADVVRNARDQRQQRLALEEARQKEQLALAAAVRQARRQRLMIAGLVLVVIGLSIGAVFGVRAQRRAAEQAARIDLATGSRLLDEGKVGDGLAYLVSAARREEATGFGATRILTTLTSHNFSLPVGAELTLGTPTDEVRFLAGGKSVLVQGGDGHVRLIDMAAWKIVGDFSFGQKLHPSGLRVAAKNPDVFAVVLANSTIVVCDTATGRPRFAPITPPARVGEYSKRSDKPSWTPYFAFSPDGRWLRTINDSWAIFDATTGVEQTTNELWHTHHEFDPTLTPFSPDGTRIVTSGGIVTGSARNWSLPSGSMEFRSVPDGKVLATIPLDAKISNHFRQGTTFSADGKRLLVVGDRPGSNSANSSRYALVYDTETRVPMGPPIFYAPGQVNQLWLTPDGTRVIVSSSDRTTNVYDVGTAKTVFPALVHGGPASCVGLSDDGTILATVSVNGFCRLWDLRTGLLAAEATFRQDRPSPAALSPDGRTLVVTSQSGLVHRLQLTRGPAAPLVLPRQTGMPTLVRFAAQPPARLHWFETRKVKLIDIASGRWMDDGVTFPLRITTFMRGGVTDTLRPGDTLVARFPAAPPQAWTMGENGVAQHVAFADPIATGAGFLFSPSGKYGAAPVVPTGAGEAPWVGIWDLHTGQRVAKLAGFQFAAGNLADFSPDDRNIAIFELKTDDATAGTSVPEGMRVYDLKEARFLYKIVSDEKAPFRAARFSSDSTRLLTGNAWGKVEVWDGATGKLLQSHQAHSFIVNRFDFSDDGKLYASLSQDGTVQVWDSATNEPVGAVLVHSGAISRATFSSDNTRLSTAAVDGSGRVWDLRSGLPLTDLAARTGETVGLATLSPDDRFVMTLTGGTTPTAAQRLWAAPPAGRAGRAPQWLLQLATICAGRRLNDDGKLVSAADDFDQLDAVRREIAALPAGDAYAEWARWFLSDDPARPIAPGFTITPVNAKKLADEMSAPDPLLAWTERDNALLLERKYAETEPLERQMLAWVIKRDGADSVDSVMDSHLIKLAQSLIMNGKFEEAEKIARSSLAMREARAGVGALVSSVQSARATVGSALVGQKRYAEAEPLLVPACEFFKKEDAVAGTVDLIRLQVVNRVGALVELYEATGRPEKTAEWKRWKPRQPGAAAAPPTSATTPAATAPATTPKP